MAFIAKQANDFLETLLSLIDITESAYEKATARYQEVGQYLCREGSLVARYSPDIYPQGSFLLGTVIRPPSEDEDYDIDLVSQLKISKSEISQKDFKQLVGQEITRYVDQEKVGSIEEGRRCWTVEYADGARFHLDILPALPDNEAFKEFLVSKAVSDKEVLDYADLAIGITDNTRTNYEKIDLDWNVSNPRGYAKWFRARMQAQFDRKREEIAKSTNKDVQDVPEHLVKTPLQRVVQLLKRHRDIRMAGSHEYRPISIIITTLAAQAYRNEDNILDALLNVVKEMPKFIREDGSGVYWIPNPVNPAENFADRWALDSRLIEGFFAWIKDAQSNFIETLLSDRIEQTAESLKQFVGERAIDKALAGSRPGEIGLREVRVTGAPMKPERVEITKDLFCRTVALSPKSTLGEVCASLDEEPDSYGVFVGDDGLALGLVRPDHVASWKEHGLDSNTAALSVSDRGAAFVGSTLEKESKAILRLKRVLLEHQAIVVRSSDGSYGVLNGPAYGKLIKQIGKILFIQDFLIVPPSDND